MSTSRSGTLILAPVAYATAAALVVVPVAGLSNLLPVAWNALVWRVAAIGAVMSMLVLPLAGAAAALFTAKALGHRRTLQVVAMADLIVALGVVAALLVFATDVTHLRGEMKSAIQAGVIRANGTYRFDLAILRAVFDGVLAAATFAAIGVHGWRAATALEAAATHPPTPARTQHPVAIPLVPTRK